jgi:aspartate/glutamate racemase
VILPPQNTQRDADEVIFRELVRGQVSEGVIAVLRAAIGELAREGAASIILGNTDMSLAAAELQKTSPVPLIDSARAHARAAARAALAGRL